MRRTSLIAVASLAAAFWLLMSCSVKQQVTLSTDSSGSVSMRIKVERVFMDYLNDLAALTGADNQDRVFNLEEIKKGFAERQDMELKRVASPSPDVLEMEVVFTSIEKLFSREKDLQEAGIVSFSRVKEGYAVNFHLDRRNFKQIQRFMPVLQNPVFEGLAPQEGDNTTEKEYLEMIDLAMGANGSEALKASTIETRVEVKGALVSQTGGTVSGNVVTFRVPLLRVLLLDKPLDYSVVFR